MEIREQIVSDVKIAMREKDQLKLNALRFLQAAIKNREIEMRPEPITSSEVQNVIKKLIKQRKDSIEQYLKAQRQDLADQEAAELAFLEVYLPAQLDRDQIEKIVNDVISETGAKNLKDMGLVMKAVIAKAQGQADNRLVSELIKSKLV